MPYVPAPVTAVAWYRLRYKSSRAHLNVEEAAAHRRVCHHQLLGGRETETEREYRITKPAIYQATPVTMPGTQSVKQPADQATNANGICEDWTVSDLVMFIHELNFFLRDCNAVCITANIAH